MCVCVLNLLRPIIVGNDISDDDEDSGDENLRTTGRGAAPPLVLLRFSSPSSTSSSLMSLSSIIGFNMINIIYVYMYIRGDANHLTT